MELPYLTPADLVADLQSRQTRARTCLRQLLAEPVGRLMHDLIARHGLREDPQLVVDHALYVTETMLRFRPVSAFAGTSWPAFRASLLMHLARLAMQPYGGTTGNGTGTPTPLPSSSLYDIETFFRPYARLGRHHFGGDWYAGRQLDDGSLWVFVADVTGHGYYAYLLATALPAVWQRCWAAHPGEPPQPAELLSVMHELLEDCLPEGIFLECALARLGPDGSVVVSSAGGTRLLVRSGQRGPDLLKLRGCWLGVRAPSADEQYTLMLAHGDELLLATDGLYEQLDEHGGAEVVTRQLPFQQGSLFAAIRDLIEGALSTAEQKDDITMVLLRRRTEVALPAVSHSTGEGNVPV